MIDQGHGRLEAADLDAVQQPPDLPAGQHGGQRRGPFDPDELPAAPILLAEMVPVEDAQGADHLVEGRALVAAGLLDVVEKAEPSASPSSDGQATP